MGILLLYSCFCGMAEVDCHQSSHFLHLRLRNTSVLLLVLNKSIGWRAVPLNSGYFWWKCFTVRIIGRWFMSSWIPQWLVRTAVFKIQMTSSWASHKYRTPWKIISVPLFFIQFNVWLYFSFKFFKRQGPSDCTGGWTTPKGEFQRWRVEKIWAKKWSRFRKYLF